MKEDPTPETSVSAEPEKVHVLQTPIAATRTTFYNQKDNKDIAHTGAEAPKAGQPQTKKEKDIANTTEVRPDVY